MDCAREAAAFVADWEDCECVLPQRIADALVGTVYIVVAANFTPCTHPVQPDGQSSTR